MSHSRPSLRPLYRALLILLVLSLLAPPVSAAAQGWRLAPARPAEPVVAPLDTRVARAPGETYDAFFMRVGQQDPQRLQLAALRALEYYLNNAAPGGAPADAFERMIERYLALPVAVLGSAEAHRRVAGPPAALQPVVRLPRPAAPAQAAASEPVTPEPIAPPSAPDEIGPASDVSPAAPPTEAPPPADDSNRPALAATPLPESPAPTAAAPVVATAVPTATRAPTRQLAPTVARPTAPPPTASPVAAAVPRPAAPSRETRMVGVVKVAADTFTDLGGGQTQAAGNVVLSDYLPLLGANDRVTYDATAMTATVTIAMKVADHQVDLFTGSFSAPIASGQATLGTDVSYALSKVAGFPITANLVLTQFNLAAATVAGTATLRLNPPGVDTSVSANFAIAAASGGITHSGSLAAFSLSLAGVTLAVPQGATISDAGVQAPSVTLTLPGIFGGLTASVNELAIMTDQVKLGGAQANFALPELWIGGGANSGVKFANNQATLTFDNPTQAYLLTIASTLTLSLPGNGVTVGASVTLGEQDGDPVLSGTLDSLTLNVAGTSLAMTGLQIGNDGLAVAQATLTLPGKLGGTSGTVTQVTITKDGLGFGSATLNLPDIKFGDGSRLKITGIQATLAQQNNQYVFTASATLQINLPGNAKTIGLTLTVNGNGDISGKVTGVMAAADGDPAAVQGGPTLNLAGASLSLDSPTVGNDGVSVAAATLTLPAKLGGSSLTLTGVAISKDGLSLGAATITFPDIKIGDGSKLKIAKIAATMTTAANGYTFSLTGTLQVRLPGNSTDVTLTGSVNTAGELSGAVNQITLNIASLTLSMTGLSMNSSGLSVATATLNLPGKLGNASGSVSNVTITADGLKIGGATAQISFPNFKIGSTTGFAVTGVKATISVTNNGSAYSVTLSGTIAVSIPGSNASATGSVTVDNTGNISGSVQSFSLSIAGLSLAIQNVQIAGDGSFSISSAKLTLPAGFGGGYVQLNNVVIRPGGGSNAVSIGGGSFQLPKISVGGFTLQVSGTLQKVDGGYQISANGLFNMPSLGGAAGCSGIQVGVTLYESASGQTVLEIAPAAEPVEKPDWAVNYPVSGPAGLKLKQASLSLKCSLPIGTTGFFMTSLSGAVTLDEHSTTVSVAVEIAAGKQVMGVAVASAQAQATVTSDPFSLALSGTIKVFTFTVGGASASIKPGQFYAKLWINEVVIRGQAEVWAWSDTNGFHLSGKATMAVGVSKGSIYQDCWSWRCCPNGSAYKGYNCWPWKTHSCSACICIPPGDWTVGNAAVEVGEFSKPSGGTTWGFKGQVTILGYTAAFYVDTNGSIKVGGDVDKYKLLTPVQLQAAQARWAAARAAGVIATGADWLDAETGVLFTADGEILVPVEVADPRHVSFALTRYGDAPGLELIRPDGQRITPLNLPAGITYTTVITYTVAGELETSGAPTATANLAPIELVSTAVAVRSPATRDLALANRFASRVGVDPATRSVSAVNDLTATAATTATAQLRFVHALAEVPAVDVRVDGVRRFSNIAYAAATSYVTVTAESHVVSIVPAGTGGPELARVTVDPAAGSDNSAVAIGRAASPRLLALTDDNTRPQRGEARVRLVHAAADAPAADLALDAGSPFLFGVGYAEASLTVPVDAGVHDLHVRQAGTTTDQITVPGVTLADGRVYTLFVMGLRSANAGPYVLRAALSQDAAPAGRVRFVHGLQAEALLDVWADGQLLFAGVPFGSDPAAARGPYTPYASLAPGQHTLSVTAAAAPTVPLATLPVEIVSDADVTVVATQPDTAAQAGGSNRPAQTPTQLWPVVDDNSLPLPGQARVRLIHAWAQPRLVDLAVAGGAVLIAGVGRYSASGYVALPGGGYLLEVRDTVTGQVLAALPAEPLLDGQVYSVIVRDGGALPTAELTADQVALRTIQMAYEVDEPMAGTWQAVLTGEIGQNDQYILGVTGAVADVALLDVSALPTGANTAQVGWRLVSAEITTSVSIFANPGPITTTLTVTNSGGTTTTMTAPIHAGYPLAEKLIGPPPGWTNGSPQSHAVDLDRLPSGTYHLWAQADDARTQPARVYATTPITVSHAWNATWNAQLAATPSYRALDLAWVRHPNPDVDRYDLKIGTQPGVAEQTVDVGDALEHRFAGLNPTQEYLIWLEGVDSDTGRVSASAAVRATPLAAPFTVAGPAEALAIISGQARTVTLTLTTTEAAYPDGVLLFAGDPPTSSLALAGSPASSVPAGVTVRLPDGPITPTVAGVNVRVVISTSETLPDGLYQTPLVARGGGLTRPVTVTLQAQRPYFRLSGPPTNAILSANSSITVPVFAEGVYGSADPVTLAVADPPTGLRWAFDRLVIQPGERAILTLTDTDLLARGSHTFAVLGSDGRATSTLAQVLLVHEPGFDLAAQPVTRAGVTGKAGAALYELILTGRDGWTTPVTLSVAQAAPPPRGEIYLSLLPTPGFGVQTLIVPPTSRVYVHIEWADDTPNGLYLFTVAAVSGAQQAEADLTLRLATKLYQYFPRVFKQ